MLTLNRRAGERIVIDGPCVIEVVRISPGGVRLGFEAAQEVTIIREELKDGWTNRGRDAGSVGAGTSDSDLSGLAIGEAACGEDEE